MGVVSTASDLLMLCKPVHLQGRFSSFDMIGILCHTERYPPWTPLAWALRIDVE
jgi:hypothetical protein